MKELSTAKYIYLLSVCHKFSKKIFKKFIQKYETKNLCCTKYYYDIWVTLDFNKDLILNKEKNANNTFYIKNICNNFLGSGYINDYDYKILEQINTLNDEEKLNIDSHYSKLIPQEKHTYFYKNHCKKNIYTIINLIRMYDSYSHTNPKYKYLFIPFILDYSQDIGIVHQCALLVNMEDGIFLFYEPYGTYIKYGHDYSRPIRSYLDIYKDVLPNKYLTEENGITRVKYNTFHKHFLQRDDGIQNIILTKNNNMKNEFDIKYNKLLDDIKINFDDLGQLIQKKIYDNKNPVNNTDYTINILNMLDCFDDYNPKSDKKQYFVELWNTALEIYLYYNSKSCVSITLVEMGYLFDNINMVDKYKSYVNTDKPNTILMQDLYNLINELYPENNKITKATDLYDFCNEIYM